MTMVVVVAQRPGQFLIQTSDRMGRILDERGLHEDSFLPSLLARGYWESVKPGMTVEEARQSLQSIAEKFDPSQPRDEQGQWTETGAGGFRSDPKLAAEAKAGIEAVGKLLPQVTSAPPTEWQTGTTPGSDKDDPDYARTATIARALTVLRTQQLLEERHITANVERPTYSIEETSWSNPSARNYAVRDSHGHLVSGGYRGWDSLQEAKAQAEKWADAMVKQTKKVLSDPATLIQNVWDDWKSSSSSGLGLSLQLAAARELGGDHRMTPEEVSDAERTAVTFGGIKGLQTYVRAQWETTQFIMDKAGESSVGVYRGLQLASEEVDKTAHIYTRSDGTPVTPKNIKEEIIHGGLMKMVTFEFNGDPLTEVSPLGSEPGSIRPTVPESTEVMVERRIRSYAHDQTLGTKSLVLTQLPQLSLLRAGAQSTTSIPSVANGWGGVGKLPPDPTRVVLRIQAPATSVLSLPVYGDNEQEEAESVLIGTKDKWAWDAWRHTAPIYAIRPIKGTEAAQKSERLVIDLQAEDRDRPHWMTSVDWTTISR